MPKKIIKTQPDAESDALIVELLRKPEIQKLSPTQLELVVLGALSDIIPQPSSTRKPDQRRERLRSLVEENRTSPLRKAATHPGTVPSHSPDRLLAATTPESALLIAQELIEYENNECLHGATVSRLFREKNEMLVENSIYTDAVLFLLEQPAQSGHPDHQELAWVYTNAQDHTLKRKVAEIAIEKGMKELIHTCFIHELQNGDGRGKAYYLLRNEHLTFDDRSLLDLVRYCNNHSKTMMNNMDLYYLQSDIVDILCERGEADSLELLSVVLPPTLKNKLQYKIAIALARTTAVQWLEGTDATKKE